MSEAKYPTSSRYVTLKKADTGGFTPVPVYSTVDNTPQLSKLWDTSGARAPSRFSWNERFQHAWDAKDSPQKYEHLAELSSEFIDLAKTYSKLIIAEQARRDHAVAPSERAGGVNVYQVNGLAFALVHDPVISEIDGTKRYKYGGGYPSYEKAAKAAGHDLKGSIAYFRAAVEGLQNVRVPLQIVIDYRGYRCVASPVLPLGVNETLDPPKESRLCYGSADGGNTVENADVRFRYSMESCAETLGLAAHKVGESNVQLHTAGDVQGHIGWDGRSYLFSLARAFPPESSGLVAHLESEKDSQAVFYRLLRPELLLRRKQLGLPALSADAYSPWGSQEQDKFNAEVHKATEYLLKTVVPEFVRELSDEKDHKAIVVAPLVGASASATAAATATKTITVVHLSAGEVNHEFHSRGINIRHAGLVRSLISYRNPSNAHNRGVLLAEIVARALKAILRQSLRDVQNVAIKFEKDAAEVAARAAAKAAKLRAQLEAGGGGEPSPGGAALESPRAVPATAAPATFTSLDDLTSSVDTQLTTLLVNFLNLVSGSHVQSDKFWKENVLTALHARFGWSALTFEERGNIHQACYAQLGPIITHTLAMCGYVLTPLCVSQMTDKNVVGFPFTGTDVIESDLRIKYMPVLDYCQGMALAAHAYDLLLNFPALPAHLALAAAAPVPTTGTVAEEKKVTVALPANAIDAAKTLLVLTTYANSGHRLLSSALASFKHGLQVDVLNASLMTQQARAKSWVLETSGVPSDTLARLRHHSTLADETLLSYAAYAITQPGPHRMKVIGTCLDWVDELWRRRLVVEYIHGLLGETSASSGATAASSGGGVSTALELRAGGMCELSFLGAKRFSDLGFASVLNRKTGPTATKREDVILELIKGLSEKPDLTKDTKLVRQAVEAMNSASDLILDKLFGVQHEMWLLQNMRQRLCDHIPATHNALQHHIERMAKSGAVSPSCLELAVELVSTKETATVVMDVACSKLYTGVLRAVVSRFPTIELPKYLKDAAEANNQPLIRVLLDVRADASITDKTTALILTAQESKLPTAQTLIHAKVNIDARDEQGMTALIWAARDRQGGSNLVKLLLESKSQVHTHDKEGKTALMYSCISGSETTLALLLFKANAQIEATDNFGMTPLMWAAKSGRKEQALVLVNSKANVFKQDKEGKTCMDHAADGPVKEYLTTFFTKTT